MAKTITLDELNSQFAGQEAIIMHFGNRELFPFNRRGTIEKFVAGEGCVWAKLAGDSSFGLAPDELEGTHVGGTIKNVRGRRMVILAQAVTDLDAFIEKYRCRAEFLGGIGEDVQLAGIFGISRTLAMQMWANIEAHIRAGVVDWNHIGFTPEGFANFINFSLLRHLQEAIRQLRQGNVLNGYTPDSLVTAIIAETERNAEVTWDRLQTSEPELRLLAAKATTPK